MTRPTAQEIQDIRDAPKMERAYNAASKTPATKDSTLTQKYADRLTAGKRAAMLRKKIAEVQDRPIGGKPAVMREPLFGNDAASSAAYDSRQNQREEEAESLESRAKGMKKGGSVKGWGQARGARAAKIV